MRPVFVTIKKRASGVAITRDVAPFLEEGELRVVWGVVYMPDILDSQNDFMTAPEIRAAAYGFMKGGDLKAIDLMHNNKRTGAYIVESFIVRPGDLDFPVVGSWVVAVHLPPGDTDDVWEAIKRGELNGFSMEALVRPVPALVQASFPGTAIGRTDVADGHGHTFEAIYDEAGVLIGGKTSVHRDAAGKTHFHVIKKGVATEMAEGHAHRFALVENFEGSAA